MSDAPDLMAALKTSLAEAEARQLTTTPAYAETTPATTSSKVDLPGADKAARATIDAIAAEEGFLPGDVIQLYKRLAELPWAKQLNLLNYSRHR